MATSNTGPKSLSGTVSAKATVSGTLTTTSDWIRLDVSHLNEVQKEEKGGITLESSLSPYDVPEAVRGHLDDPREWFVIEFRYITSEPTVEVGEDPVKILRGKRSGRIYQIRVRAPKSLPSEVEVPNMARKALDHLKRSGEQSFGPHRRINIIEHVLEEKREDLFGASRGPGSIREAFKSASFETTPKLTQAPGPLEPQPANVIQTTESRGSAKSGSALAAIDTRQS
jgi:hypothetical protein